ncbi:MAG: cytosine permease [Gemmataceae bacterium]
MATIRNELPAYVRNAVPVPLDKRAPWYVNTAPTYAGIFLWIAFYDQLAKGLTLGTLWAVLLGVVIAGAVCHYFFYYVPGLLGMKTGQPLYIVGTSTFGIKGGYFIPGIFMGLLQIGWYSVATYYATKLILNGLGYPAITPYGLEEEGYARAWDATFIVLAFVWGYLFALVGGLGIEYVARVAQIFPVVPIVMLLLGGVLALPHLKAYIETPVPSDFDTTYVSAGTLLMIQLIVGFFGTAGAVGADFCANNRTRQDVSLGGLVGIWAAIVFTAGLAIVTVAGAHGADPTKIASLPADERYRYGQALQILGPAWLSRSMLILFAIGSMAPACFCSFIIGNSLSTMLGKPQARIPITLAGTTVGISIAVTGASANLAPYFGLIGASFGPVIGAMAADYFLSGGEWSGPREGVNWAGYLAWIVGFLVGISNNDVVAGVLGFKPLADWHPTGVYSLLIGAVVYVVAARTIGLPARIPGAVPVVRPADE